MNLYFLNMSIQSHFDQIEKLFSDFHKQNIQIEIMNNFFYDMHTNPTKFWPIPCPIDIYSLNNLFIANNRLYAMNIYTTLESLYTEIIKYFDPTCLDPEIWNIRISSILSKVVRNSKQGRLLWSDNRKKLLIKSIENSINFDYSTTPAYSIIHSFSEWRWANAHYSIWSNHIDLITYWNQFKLHKVALIELHERLQRYLIELKSSSLNTDFDSFT